MMFFLVSSQVIPFGATAKTGHPFDQPAAGIIRGTVTNTDGLPLEGVSITIKGSSTGTSTDAMGLFSINITVNNVTLVISSIGYETQEIVTGNNNELLIQLQPSASNLKDVVVVGYGTQRKNQLIGSIAQVSGEDLSKRTTPKLSQALTGQLPGVTIIQPSGQPGVGAGTIQIRGVGSFGAGTAPLILVDGIPTNSFNDVDPNDVESISVLKDASSAAIYGARASNGVILINTKTGKSKDKLRIGYNGYIGLQRPTALPEYVSSAEYARLTNEAVPNSYTEEQIKKFADGSDPDNYPNTDFFKEVLKKNSLQTAHNINISNGNKSSQYLLSAGYLSQDGIVAKNNFNRYNIRLNLTSNISSKLKLTTRLSAVQTINNEPAPPASLDFTDMLGIISNLVRFPSTFAVKLSNGDWGLGNNNKGTPVSFLESASFYKYKGTDLGANFRLDYTLLDGLQISAIGGYTQFSEKSKRFIASQRLNTNITLSPANLTQSNQVNTYKTLQALAEYNKNIRQHGLNVLAGYSFESNYTEATTANRAGFASNDLTELNAGSASSQTNSGYAEEWALESLFGRLRYNFDNKYLLEGTLRYDGSSRFPPTHKYALFPSIAGGWRLGQQRFIKDHITWIDELKLKASYGILGNQNIGIYPYQNLLVSGYNYPFGGVVSTGLARTSITDTTIHWESTRTTDAGIELSVFKHLLSFSATWFDKKTENILVSPSASVSNVLGFTVGVQNSGKLRNRGWEFTLGHENKIGSVSYSIATNLSIIKNTVLDLGIGNVQQPNGLVGNGSNLFIGHPINIYYGYEADGLFVDQADIDSWANQSAIAPNPKPGDIRYKDISGPNGKRDGVVNASYDRKVLGSTIPKYAYGINLGAAYKGFDISVLLQGVAGVSGYLSGYAGWAFNNIGNVQRWQADERWTAANPDRNAQYPRLEQISNQGTNNTISSSFWILNGSYLRIRSLQAGYTFSASSIKRVGAESLRVNLSAENLHTWSRYRSGWDPEINTGGNYYPILANYTLGVSVNF